MPASGGVLRHAVDALPRSALRWQAGRAALLERAPPLDPHALPGAIVLTPGLDHAVYARRAAIVSAVLGVMAVFMLRDESMLLEFRLLACLPLGVCLWLTVEFFHLSRVLPQQMTLRLSADGVEIETERGTQRRPLGEFAGVAIRSRVLSRGLPERMLRRRSLAEIRDRVYERRTLHWIELTDRDYRGSVPLWVLTGHDAFDRARVLRAARVFAEALGLPLISTGGIDPAETGRAESLPGLAAAPSALRAVAAREAVHPDAVVRETRRPPRPAAAPVPRKPGSLVLPVVVYALAMLVVGGTLWLVRIASLEADGALMTAVAVEMLLLLILCIALAAMIVLALDVPARPRPRLAMAGVAMLLLLTAELGLSVTPFEAPLDETLASYRSPTGLLRLVGQATAALVPALFLLIPSRG